jgi:hypothetical protein
MRQTQDFHVEYKMAEVLRDVWYLHGQETYEHNTLTTERKESQKTAVAFQLTLFNIQII